MDLLIPVSEWEVTVIMNFPEEDIPKEKFVFVQKEKVLHEQKLKTKPVGYFKDALIRFSTNKGSVICFCIILVLILYAVFAPLFSSYGISYHDPYYSYASPRCSVTARFGFWDGTVTRTVNRQTFEYYNNIPGAIVINYGQVNHTIAGRIQKWYKIKIDSYKKVGWVKKLLTVQEYNEAKSWEQKTGVQLFYPIVNSKKIKNIAYKDDPNAWFLTNIKGVAEKSTAGKIQNIYVKDPESKDGYSYAVKRMNGDQLETRVLYDSWYFYKHGHHASYLFGADPTGYDIFSRLAGGARLSLIFSVVVAVINLILGIIVGAFEGYYGGNFDLVLERLKEILYDIPFVVLMTLFQMYFADTAGPIVSMGFAYIFFGWIGTSSTVRAQFYRFKGQEYVLAARTLGAKDIRLIFRHILPNAAGFIITTSVLTIPAVILGESNLTYLGIVNLQSPTLTSVGTMLKNGQKVLADYPHCIFFPAAFISILLICFNEFGNGLRDAFNPSLRGAS